MLQLTFPHNVQLNASCVTNYGKPKVTRSQKHSPIVTSQAEVTKVKKRKKKKNQRFIAGEFMNVYIDIKGCEYNIFLYANLIILYSFRNLIWVMTRI